MRGSRFLILIITFLFTIVLVLPGIPACNLVNAEAGSNTEALYKPVEIVVDNTDAGFSTDSQWKSSQYEKGYYGSDYLSDNDADANEKKWAKWAPGIPQTGDYKIYMRWTAGENRPSSVPVEIGHDGKIDGSHTVNQQENGGQWVLIDSYHLRAGKENYVKISAADKGYTIADAVKFVWIPQVTDEDAVTLDTENLDIEGDVTSIVSDIRLPSTGLYDTTICWSSSHLFIVSAQGHVVRPPYDQQDAQVTLTATVSRGKASEQKTFTLHVLKSDLVLTKSSYSMIQRKLIDVIALYVGSPVAYVYNQRKYIDENDLQVQPEIIEGRTMVPARFVAECFGAKVDWDDADGIVTIWMPENTIKMKLGSKKVWVNDQEVQIDVAPQIINDHLMVPLRVAVDAMGKNVFWDDCGMIAISAKKNVLQREADRNVINDMEELFKELPGIPDDTVLLEAESFEKPGGWVVDQQFMDQMGSPYMLAHGLGMPVEDCSTTVRFPKTGLYHVWVRTKDWVAPWKAEGAPGKFQISVGGRRLQTVFGTEGAAWHWQKGESVDIQTGETVVALHDLTGFEGRCDAILFTTDSTFIPPDEGIELRQLRERLALPVKTTEEKGQYDLVVIGGGMAGTCAAVAASRLGLIVAFIQDRPTLGGNNSSEVRVWLGGESNLQPYPNIGNLVKELEQKYGSRGGQNDSSTEQDDERVALVKEEKNISLFLNYHANSVEKDAFGNIKAVSAEDTLSGNKIRVEGNWFADCTGDGTIGFLADADYDNTEEGHMGTSDMWTVEDTGSPVIFPHCPWAIHFTGKKIPPLGTWVWESGFDYDTVEDAEYIRDTNLRAMYGAWDYLKNVDEKYLNYKLNWAAYIGGKRESRRLLGDIILSEEDLKSGKKFEDGCVPATWTIDLHYPQNQYAEKGFENDPFIAYSKTAQYPRPYWIPYRTLYSHNIPNLFMAGRDISTTHEALGAVRVMRTTGMMGEVVGMAAGLCKKYQVNPRDIYQNYLVDLQQLMKSGVGK